MKQKKYSETWKSPWNEREPQIKGQTFSTREKGTEGSGVQHILVELLRFKDKEIFFHHPDRRASQLKGGKSGWLQTSPQEHTKLENRRTLSMILWRKKIIMYQNILQADMFFSKQWQQQTFWNMKELRKSIYKTNRWRKGRWGEARTY